MVGFEPTLSSTPSWRIPRLSYILKRSVQRDLNPRIHHGKVAGCQATSWTRAVPAAGIEPAPSRLQRDARPSSCTGILQSQRWDSNPHTPPYDSGTRPVEHRWLDRGWPVGVEPTQPGSQPGPATVWVRPQYPWQESNLHNFRLRRAACLRHTPGTRTVPRPGVEPGPAPSEGAMMSLSPPGQRVTREGLEPSRHGGHGLLRAACLPFHHLANISGPWRESNPHLPGASRPSSR